MNTIPNVYKYSDENLPRTQQTQKERNINKVNEKRKKLFKTTGVDKFKIRFSNEQFIFQYQSRVNKSS